MKYLNRHVCDEEEETSVRLSPILRSKRAIDVIEIHAYFVLHMCRQRLAVRDVVDEFDGREKIVGHRFLLSFAYHIGFAVHCDKAIALGARHEFREHNE